MTEKEQKFVAVYKGDLEKAADRAGISVEAARRLLATPEVADQIRAKENQTALQKFDASVKEERVDFFTKIMRAEPKQLHEMRIDPDSVKVDTRMRAAELLCKINGDFVTVTKHEMDGPLVGINLNVAAGELDDRLKVLLAKKVTPAVAGWLE